MHISEANEMEKQRFINIIKCYKNNKILFTSRRNLSTKGWTEEKMGGCK